MGVRFPLEQSRPDLAEIQEVAPPTRSAADQEVKNRGPADARTQNVLRPDEPSSANAAKAENENQIPSTFKTTGNLIDILA